jgi:hypothetical protein
MKLNAMLVGLIVDDALVPVERIEIVSPLYDIAVQGEYLDRGVSRPASRVLNHITPRINANGDLDTIEGTP